MKPGYDWVAIFAPALPTTIVTIVGFFIFHLLAARRQRRDEIYKDVLELIRAINAVVAAGDSAWQMPGADAVKSGAISNVRFQFTQIGIVARHLQRMNTQFGQLDRPLRELKKNMDERFDDKGQPAENLSDLERAPLPSCSEHAYASANMLKNGVYRIFVEIYS